MTDFSKIANFDISVVIPALNAEDYMSVLLKSIERQTLLPREIVIVDSSFTDRTAEVVRKGEGTVPINYKKIDFAYPGHARNIGVKAAQCKWIAFLDCRTLPEQDWLQQCAFVALQEGAEYVGSFFICDADSHFKEIIRSATYGHSANSGVCGSLVLKSVFEQSGGFIPYVRSGEDIEWRGRLKSNGVRMGNVMTPTIKYYGLPASLLEAVKKWHIYAMANAMADVYNNQKKAYLLISFSLLLLFVYKWNAVFARWDERSIYYIPDITKLFVGIVFLLYVFYRGIIRPLQVKVKLSHLLPWRWLEISFVGLCLDLAKAPGLIWGALLLMRRRMSGLQHYFRTHRKMEL